MSFRIPDRPDRRTAIKWMLAAAASATIPLRGRGQGADPQERGRASDARPPSTVGYGTDPNLVREYKPGDLWPLTMTDTQRATAAALCAVVIPADEKSPSAADLHVHDFIDEWISSPYPEQQHDREPILKGLVWIEEESGRRFGKGFDRLSDEQRVAICDDICDPAQAKPELADAAAFFARFRALTTGGFYTTPEGMSDIGYVGNRPSLTFEGPSPEILKQVGLA